MKLSNETPTRVPSSNSLYIEQALGFSHDYARRYHEQHSAIAGMTEGIRSHLAEARLQAMLEEHRRQLDGRLTYDEFIRLLDCFQGELFDPHGVEDMVGALHDHAPQNAPLLRKLASLSMGEKFALADLVEQAWYRSAAEETSVTHIAGMLGISFAPSVTAD